MSYQVLARKWRPNRFGELVGQEHVVTAISNALDNNRLHHAYLFTGTRGVGKTTIARIFSKSLNCEQGLSAKPCGQCSTCKEIENGNFIDLLEIDAASRTKVEDTRELLDNVQYKPSRGRYKVYLIDEVHMLSKHSFNALLKTLEEPPPHVKFLLATTDPQKLPVTILSRCLQFNLKALSRSQISQQLEYVLGQENIPFDKESLVQLSRAAQGSMRDALSLTDQAIAQGNGVVSLQIVTDMLGLMDKNQVLKLVHAIVQKDSQSVMQQVEFMANQAPDFALVLAEIMSLLHQVALTQFVPDACKLETISARAIYQLAKSVPAEHIQLLYQIALTGKKDLPHAVDARTGLEMTLLRMLAFSPDNLKLDAADIAGQTPRVQNSNLSDQSQATVISNSELNLQASTVESGVSDVIETTEPLVAESPTDLAQDNTRSQIKPEPQLSELSANQAPQDTEQTGASEESEQDLFAQQQDILSQAESYGHQSFDYNEFEPVTLEEHAQFSAEPSSDHTEDSLVHSQVDVEQQPAPAFTSTADLIALRNKLKESQRTGEEENKQVKKSESAAPFDLAAIRAKQNSGEDPGSKNTPEPSTDIELADKQIETIDTSSALTNIQVAPVTGAEASNHKQDTDIVVEQPVLTPPWPIDVQVTDNSPVSPSPFSAPKALQEAEYFDPNAHLDDETVGEVTLEIPAFLDNKQKVIKALQVDDWSKLIEDMQVTALTKQLALHSSFSQQGNTVKLRLHESKLHLMSDTAQQQLKGALCEALNTPVDLEIELGRPINTPYALQLKVNQVRQDYAREVVKSDPGLQLLQQHFAAKIDEQSIQAR